LKTGDAFVARMVERVVRPLSECWQPWGSPVGLNMLDLPEQTSLVDVTEGPYLVVSTMLDTSSVCCVDATCRRLYAQNGMQRGPWCMLGSHAFMGLELEQDGLFEQLVPCLGTERGDADGRKLARIDWKSRYLRFLANVPMFATPFGSREITVVAQPDEVAYFRGRLRTDVLTRSCSRGVYLEVEVLCNPDNLSMAVADFEAGGCSSVTFSPDVGAVIRERKVCEEPRKVEGAYIQPLPAIEPPARFHGRIGLYLFQGKLAFFRRCASTSEEDKDAVVGPWETTGFVSDISWAEGRRLTPCIAFRDEGAYRARIVCVGMKPPIDVPMRGLGELQEDVSWSSFDWEAGAPNLREEPEA